MGLIPLKRRRLCVHERVYQSSRESILLCGFTVKRLVWERYNRTVSCSKTKLKIRTHLRHCSPGTELFIYHLNCRRLISFFSHAVVLRYPSNIVYRRKFIRVKKKKSHPGRFSTQSRCSRTIRRFLNCRGGVVTKRFSRNAGFLFKTPKRLFLQISINVALIPSISSYDSVESDFLRHFFHHINRTLYNTIVTVHLFLLKYVVIF